MKRTPSSDEALSEVAARITEGRRLHAVDGAMLYASGDVHEIGRLANLVRERFHGGATYYNVNRHINYTNY
ncbi:MAG TPA: aminofutalosine synthase MqnE, partial [Phycisphaerae bacterium]|nr:aminofutalosine synthase MqnE [Phycisphaerae bacterium]